MRNMYGRRLRTASLVLLLVAVGPSGRPAVAQGIADNSFLIEEAYNQEPGVVQHISVWQRSLRAAPWAFTFTQEWPLVTQRHQLSYTVPFQRTESPARQTGFGDVAINYRYQLHFTEHGSAIAPRVSLLLPTGSETRGLGSGSVGGQVNLPISVPLGSAFVSHWNAGVSAVPDVTTYSLGASMIWLLRPTFNVMLEVVWTDQTSGTHDVVVNPGIRWAHNFASGLQIVPGLSFPDARAALLYLSFEHRFRSENASQ